MPAPVEFRWHGEALADDARRQMARRLYAAGELLKTSIQRSLSHGRPASSPGEPPHADTGRLRASIFAYADPRALTLQVGTDQLYGLWLEYGTLGGKVIKPKNARALSWVDGQGVRRFAKWVVQGAIKPRPFLRPAVQREWRAVRSVLTARFTDVRGYEFRGVTAAPPSA